jgi:hypothetical protein
MYKISVGIQSTHSMYIDARRSGQYILYLSNSGARKFLRVYIGFGRTEEVIRRARSSCMQDPIGTATQPPDYETGQRKLVYYFVPLSNLLFQTVHTPMCSLDMVLVKVNVLCKAKVEQQAVSILIYALFLVDREL